VAQLVEQEQESGLGRGAVAAAALLFLASACDPSASSQRPSPGDPARPGGAEASTVDTRPEAKPETEAEAGMEIGELRLALDAARSRIAELEADSKLAAAERIAREEEWLRYTKALSQLSAAGEKPVAEFQTMADVQAAPTEPAPDDTDRSDEEVAASAKRDREILVSLRSLFAIEQVTGYDLLETGTLGEGFTGPIVLRALDGRGRPIGTIAAERMRLEGSRSARSLTIVLEDGYEKRGGETIAFVGPGTEEGRGGALRIELPDIDPSPWIGPLAELFREEDKAPAEDDGTWDLGTVRATLNLLLREDVGGGWWRLVGLGGVQAGVFRDVQVDQLDPEGRLERKLFADRMEITEQEKGLKIELSDGAQMRGDAKTMFLDGRYRIFLPRASVEAWRKAGIPGLSAPPQSR
jgi:hypothetical protein